MTTHRDTLADLETRLHALQVALQAPRITRSMEKHILQEIQAITGEVKALQVQVKRKQKVVPVEGAFFDVDRYGLRNII